MTFFWADTHFFHAGIIGFCSRPADTVEGMNEQLIAAWNATVGPRDTIWFLGDFAFRPPKPGDLRVLFDRLQGRKHLVVGNHDERNPAVLKLPWQRVEKLYTFKDGGRRAELCHYALETWKASHNGAIHLHGHSHGTMRRQMPRRFDIGCDNYRSGPVSWDQVCLWADAERDWHIATDHHDA